MKRNRAIAVARQAPDTRDALVRLAVMSALLLLPALLLLLISP